MSKVRVYVVNIKNRKTDSYDKEYFFNSKTAKNRLKDIIELAIKNNDKDIDIDSCHISYIEVMK